MKQFMINGQELLQRQQWILVDKSTLIRKIENSRDGGKSWSVGLMLTLKRKA